MKRVRTFNTQPFVISSDGMIVLDGTPDGFQVWDTSAADCNDWTQGLLLREEPNYTFLYSMSFDGSLLALAHDEPHRVAIRSTQTGEIVRSIPFTAAIDDIIFPGTHKDWIAVFSDGHIAFFSIDTGERVGEPIDLSSSNLFNFEASVGGEVWGNDCQATRICSPTTHRTLPSDISTRCVTSDGKYVFLTDDQQEPWHLRVYDVEAGVSIDRGELPAGCYDVKAVSPDGKYIAVVASHVDSVNTELILMSIDDQIAERRPGRRL